MRRTVFQWQAEFLVNNSVHDIETPHTEQENNSRVLLCCCSTSISCLLHEISSGVSSPFAWAQVYYKQVASVYIVQPQWLNTVSSPWGVITPNTVSHLSCLSVHCTGNIDNLANRKNLPMIRHPALWRQKRCECDCRMCGQVDISAERLYNYIYIYV